MEHSDQMGRSVWLDSIPKRIVSLVPSQTELLYDLGLEEEVVGITKFCIYPESWYRSKTRVGGTKSVHIGKVRELQPDLIIGNKEENSEADIEQLREIAPVWMSDIYTLEDALQMIESIGRICDQKERSLEFTTNIRVGFDELKKTATTMPTFGRSVAYFIWDEPAMLAGKQTFIDAMLSCCGLVNATNELRYPAVETAEDPEYVFLSSEPYPFGEAHLEIFRKRYPNAHVMLVDGEMFSWYGSRLLKAPAYFRKVLDQMTTEQ